MSVETPSNTAGTRRRRPGLLTWSVVLLFVALSIVALAMAPVWDRAYAHLTFFVCNMIALGNLMFWFTFRSSYSGWTRLLAPLSLMGLVVGLVYCFPVVSFSGTMRPTFRWRWAPRADQILIGTTTTNPPADLTIDLATTTDADFPQFLGPNRNLTIVDVDLAREWESTAPRQMWRQPIGTGWSAFSAVNGYAVTMEQRGDQELVTCYEIQTGRLVWSHSETSRHATLLGGAGPRSTPTIHGGKVYALGATGRLLCLNGADGSVVWRRDLLQEYGTNQTQDEQVVAWGRANSPLVVDRLVIVPAGGLPGHLVSLVAYDHETGERVWEGGDTQISYASPAIATLCDQLVVLSVNESNLTAHDPATGDVLWFYPWPGSSSSSASASQPQVIDDDRVLLSKGYGGGSELLKVERSTDGRWSVELVWANPRVLKTKFTNVAIVDQCAYGLSDGILECVDVENGRSLWKRGRYEHGQLLAIDDLLLVMSENGELVLVEATPRSHRELGRIQALQGTSWNNLCLYGKLLLVRNGNEAACYELP